MLGPKKTFKKFSQGRLINYDQLCGFKGAYEVESMTIVSGKYSTKENSKWYLFAT